MTRIGEPMPERPDDKALPAAGWYPDPEQAATQRYWTGSEWTEQRAPLATAAARTMPSFPVPTIVAMIAGSAAIVGTFLPRLDSGTFIKIVDNTMIQSGAGLWVVVVAIVGMAAAYADRAKRRSIPVLITGLLIAGAAVYSGTGERTELESASPGAFERFDLNAPRDTASPGVGIFVVGLSGLAMFGVGLVGNSEQL